MAKTNNNKRGKKRRLNKSSSDQKENKPKKVKVNKSNPNDTIPMSSQLLMKKKTARNNTRGKRQCKTNNRVYGNSKIMPSLSDLEKMFEDSDEDSDGTPANNNNNNEVLEVPDTLPGELSVIINPDELFSPTTRSKIKEQVKEILSNIGDSNICQDDIANQPPKKRLKLCSFESDDIPLTKTATENQDSITSTVHEPNIQDIDNNFKESHENMTCNVIDNGNGSDTSSESNNTIEYKVDAYNMVETGSVSQRFSPLPSTSTNNQIFIKNDELFHKSLQEASLLNNRQREDRNLETTEIPTEAILDDETREKQDENNLNNKVTVKNEEQSDIAPMKIMLTKDKQAENEETDLQIIEIPTETILILDDDIKNEAPENNNNIETINDIEEQDSKNQSVEIHDDDDDDDCIFVETQKEPDKPTPTVTDVIDLEYEFIEPSINIDTTNNVDDEIIDVDAIIAQNQTILEQYKPESQKLNSTNLVVDVDVSTITGNSNNNTNEIINNQICDVISEESRITSNVQIPTTSSDAVPSTSRNIPSTSNGQSEPIRRHRKRHKRYQINNNFGSNGANSSNHNQESYNNRNMIQHHVQDFFRNYRPPDDRFRENTHTHLDMNLGDIFRSVYSVLSDHATHYWSDDFSRSLPGQRNINTPSSLSPISPNYPTSFQRFNTSSSSQRHNTTSSQTTAKPPRRRNNMSHSASCSALNEQTHNTDAAQPRTLLKTHDKTAVIEGETPPTQEKSGSLGDCPICMETLSGNVIASTICGHVFCMRCLQQAIASNKRCPTCRKILKKNGYHQIFL